MKNIELERLPWISQVGPTNHTVLKKKAEEWAREMPTWEELNSPTVALKMETGSYESRNAETTST